MELDLHHVARSGDKAAMLHSLRLGASVHTVDNDRRTPLHNAAYHGNTETSQVLLDHDASAHAVDRRGRTPLSYAALDLVRESTRSDTPRPAEVHMVGRPEQHIALVRKVTIADELAGHVLAAFPVDVLSEAVAKVPLERGKRIAQYG